MIDIGANLTSTQFQAEVHEVIARAQAFGVEHIIVTGTSFEATLAASKLVQQYPEYLSYTAGVHPHAAKDWTLEGSRFLEQTLLDPRCVAVGECGLDYYRMLSTPDEQVVVFESQIYLAIDTLKPLFLHCRGGLDSFLAILNNQHNPPGVVHCFTEGVDELRQILDAGYDIGVTGWVTDSKRGADLQKAVSYIPLDRMHIETDAPYLLPKNAVHNAKHRVRRNEPMYLASVLSYLAECLGQQSDTLQTQFRSNAQRLFNLHIK